MSKDANEYWIARGHGRKDIRAVSPGLKTEGAYARWKRERLQEWTVRQIVRHQGAQVGRLVDLGCGFGDWTVLFATVADEVIACDISPGFVDECRRRLAEAGCKQFSVTCQDIRSFEGYRDADVVYLGAVMMYLSDEHTSELLRKVRARLKPGGLLVFRDWCAVNLGRATTNSVSTHFSVHRRPADYERLVADAGYAMIQVAPSWTIYGDEMAERARWLRWPLRLGWKLSALHWLRGSVSFVARAPVEATAAG